MRTPRRPPHCLLRSVSASALLVAAASSCVTTAPAPAPEPAPPAAPAPAPAPAEPPKPPAPPPAPSGIQPRDWSGDVIYFVLIDRFADGDPANNVQVDPKQKGYFHGGDLKGLTDHL